MPLVRVILGALGLILTIPALVVTLSIGTGSALDPLASATRDLTDGMDRLGATLEHVDSSLRSAEATLKDAQGSATNAASVTASLGTAMSDLADAADLRVFGTQPFAPLIPQFSQLATRSAALAVSLRSTGTSLGSSRAELLALHDDIAALAQLARRLSPSTNDGNGDPRLVVLRVMASGLLAWLAALAALMLFDARRGMRGRASG
jgi:hypothetical protein